MSGRQAIDLTAAVQQFPERSRIGRSVFLFPEILTVTSRIRQIRPHSCGRQGAQVFDDRHRMGAGVVRAKKA